MCSTSVELVDVKAGGDAEDGCHRPANEHGLDSREVMKFGVESGGDWVLLSDLNLIRQGSLNKLLVHRLVTYLNIIKKIFLER